MRRFQTFLIIDKQSISLLNDMLFDEEWKIELIDDPSYRFWDSNTDLGFMVSNYSLKKEERIKEKQRYDPSKSLIIHAVNEKTAELVNELLFTSDILIHPDRLKKHEIPTLIELRDDKIDFMQFATEFRRINNGYLSFLATKISFKNESLIYSLMKYKLSLSLDWFSPHSANPKYGQIFDNYYTSYEYHVDAAFAINTAYSVIEELQLEIRSSKLKPTFNEDKTDFHKKVRMDLEKRLKFLGLKSSEKTQWILRGEATELDKKIIPTFGKRIYPDSQTVLDVEIELIEALQKSRYIRNFITAHRFTEVSKYISPYDVFNIQFLSRKLLLYKLGLWDLINPIKSVK